MVSTATHGRGGATPLPLRAKQVDKFKQSLSTKQLIEKQFRTKVIDFISKKNSRQEFVPLIGKLIEKAHVEPLHVNNNAWQYFLRVF